MLGLNDILTYPTLPGDDHGGHTARLIFANWKPDLFVTLYDCWMGAYTEQHPDGVAAPIHPHWIPQVMADHEPIPEATVHQVREAFRVISPTKYCQSELARFGVDSEYIPLGVDTNNFKPTENQKADKNALGKRSVPLNVSSQLPIDEDSFVVVINGANKDPYRKGFTRMFLALQLFFDACPEARQKTRVYIHSWMKQARDLPHGAHVLGVDQYCRGTSDYHNLCGVPDDGMARIYGAADVFLHLSEGGGFEIPLLEAMSSGLPVICTDFIVMRELGEGHGWLIPPIREGKAVSKYITPLDAAQCIANEEKACDALLDAYHHPEKRVAFGKAGREFALNYDWSIVNRKWIELFESIRDEWAYRPLKDRKL